MSVSVCIVSHNTREELRRCLASIARFEPKVIRQVIVVDNGSSDSSVSMLRKSFPNIQLVCNGRNLWFSRANNQALEQARGKYVFFLNPDAYFTRPILSGLVAWLERHPHVGAIEPRQMTVGRAAATGSLLNRPLTDAVELTALGREFLPHTGVARFRQVRKDRSENWPTEVVSGAALFARTSAIRAAGGFNERLLLYYTDVDLCRRLLLRGWGVWHVGRSAVGHSQSASTMKLSWWSRSGIYARDALFYYLTAGEWLGGAGLFALMSLDRWLIALKHNFALVSILVLATFLRLYRLPETMMFIGDFGRDYLAARDLLLGTSFPLLGIHSSVPWLRQGPYGVWLTSAGLWISRFHPVGPALVMALLGVLAVLATYHVGRLYFNHRAGLLAALLLSTSPLVVAHARMPFHTAPIPLVTALFLLALGLKRWFFSGLFAGFLLETELSNVPLLFLVPLALVSAKRLRPVIGQAGFGFVLPLIPRFLYDLNHGWTQTVGLAGWVVYRLGLFAGTLSLARIRDSGTRMGWFIGEFAAKFLFGQ